MRWRAVCVFLLVVTAGCNAFGGNGDQRPAASVTPAPVPTDTRTAEPAMPAVPPGITRTGIGNMGPLVDSHVQAARNTRWVWTSTMRITETDGTDTAESVSTRTVWFVDERRYRQEANRTGNRSALLPNSFGDYREYADGTVTYKRWFSFEADRTVYQRVETVRADDTFPGFAANPIRTFLALESATVSRLDAGESQYYEVVGSRPRLPGYGPVESYRARAVVRADGFVRRLNVTYTVDQPDGQFESHYQFNYRQVGNATVERPDWVDTAENRTAQHRDDTADSISPRPGSPARSSSRGRVPRRPPRR